MQRQSRLLRVAAAHHRYHRLPPQPVRLHPDALPRRDRLEHCVVLIAPLLRGRGCVAGGGAEPVETAARRWYQLACRVKTLAARRDDRLLLHFPPRRVAGARARCRAVSRHVARVVSALALLGPLLALGVLVLAGAAVAAANHNRWLRQAFPAREQRAAWVDAIYQAIQDKVGERQRQVEKPSKDDSIQYLDSRRTTAHQLPTTVRQPSHACSRSSARLGPGGLCWSGRSPTQAAPKQLPLQRWWRCAARLSADKRTTCLGSTGQHSTGACEKMPRTGREVRC
jgi:hypothetical protein|eukprot:COSAG06_NODE_7781_length_2378_cov_2.511189_3_plen_283_part_00